MTSPVLNFGVLLLPEFQILDAIGPVDYIDSHSKRFLSPNFPASIVNKAAEIKWHYISYARDLTPVAAGAGPLLIPTCTYWDCPPLDYLIVPGPDPHTPLPEGCAEFLKSRFAELKLLLLVCTGSIIVAPTGLIDGLRVCSNKSALKMMKEEDLLRKEVNWVGDRRWIKDGKVWSAAGVTAGIDLAAEFSRVHFDSDIVQAVELLFEYAPQADQPDEFSKILDGVVL